MIEGSSDRSANPPRDAVRVDDTRASVPYGLSSGSLSDVAPSASAFA
jgi:hypothetical protein